jgi:UDP-N-acetylmuramoyl-L-alanyl-D-glutamate--2,6-diaminopimelate ligase
MPRTLSEICQGIKPERSIGPAEQEIEGLCYDSRAAKPGYLFFALPGIHADGNRFIDSAIDRGARAIVHSRELGSYREGVSYLRVGDPRAAMASIAAAFHGNPAESLAVIGVTGTEGKSSTVSFIYQLLRLSGRKAGFFSTVEFDVGSGPIPNPEHQTTPESITVHERLAAMRDSGLDYAVIEASSHGLSKRTARLLGIPFDAGVMTNVTHEHLEFHGSWEAYRDDKASLFRALGAAPRGKRIGDEGREVPRFGVVNAEDQSAEYFARATDRPVYRYGFKAPRLDLRASGIVERGGALEFELHWEGGSSRAALPFSGAFNAENAMAALLAASGITGGSIGEFVPLLSRLKPVKGRMSRVDRGQPFDVVVDYAHTPSSFERVIPSLKRAAKGRLICVFGSGGERDRIKRPLQGAIASRYADIVVLTDEDPRGEEPLAILEEIAAGCEGLARGETLLLVPDRPKAIRLAFSMARPGDLVALLGKSHENSIIYASGSIPYDELGEAAKALAELGYREDQE